MLSTGQLAEDPVQRSAASQPAAAGRQTVRVSRKNPVCVSQQTPAAHSTAQAGAADTKRAHSTVASLATRPPADRVRAGEPAGETPGSRNGWALDGAWAVTPGASPLLRERPRLVMCTLSLGNCGIVMDKPYATDGSKSLGSS